MLHNNKHNALLDDQWVVAIRDEADAMPYDAADVFAPEEMGRLDALDGICDPIKHYTRLGQIELYLIGWNEAVEAMADDVEFVADSYRDGYQDAIDGIPCGTFRYYECRMDRVNYVYGYRQAQIDEMDEANADYRDYQVDVEWIRRGC